MGATFEDILHGQDIPDTVAECIAGQAGSGMGNMWVVGT